MKLDSNGYAPSLFNTESGECYICGETTGTERHEVFGASNRNNSKFYGLWINVCPSCHRNGRAAIHRIPNEYEWLKKEAQGLFENAYPEQDFMVIFGKNYR